jgi:holin-like protein
MLAQLALLMIFQCVGEAVVTGLGIMFPGPLCGMILLLVYLFAKGGPSKELHIVGTTLIDHLGLLFVPAGTAIVAYGALFARDGLPVIAALFVSTTVAVHISGVIAERLSASGRLEIDHARA